jgi:hypothetical protein
VIIQVRDKFEKDDATRKAKVEEEEDQRYGDFRPATVVDDPSTEQLYIRLVRATDENVVDEQVHHHQAMSVSYSRCSWSYMLVAVITTMIQLSLALLRQPPCHNRVQVAQKGLV